MAQAARTKMIHTELVGEVRAEGIMHKMPVNKPIKPGKEKLWKERYFVLADNIAYYQDKETYTTGKKPKGVICLDYATVEQNLAADPLVFIIRTPGKSVGLKGATVPESDRWVSALKKLVTSSMAGDEDDEDVTNMLYRGT